jgi:arginine decarboxylase
MDDIPVKQTPDRMERWAEGHFGIGDDGCVAAVFRHDDGHDAQRIAVHAVVDELRRRGATLPALIRFPQMISTRVERLQQAFREAAQAHGIPLVHCALFPVKANQQRSVLEAVAAAPGAAAGLEAGSKPELLAALAWVRAGAPIVCNGFKDGDFVRAALVAREAGHAVYVVIERLEEVRLVLQASAELGIAPLVGLRVRVSPPSSTRWADPVEGAKFGLSAAQLVSTVEAFRRAGCVEAIQLVHFHMGSQVGDLADYRQACRQGLRHAVALRALGCPIDVVDVGGGLGIDHDASAGGTPHSTNFGVDEYAQAVTAEISASCAAHGLPLLRVFTETGRWLCAHHALLVCEAAHEPVDATPGAHAAQLAERPAVGWGVDQVRDAYFRGAAGLAELAAAEVAHDGARRAAGQVSGERVVCNFSLFQSLPDHWALGQPFPVLPVNGRVHAPGLPVHLHDLTCDSDGCLQAQGVLLSPATSGPTVLAVFLVGAYQEVLGSSHNLFGRVDVVEARMTADGTLEVSHVARADTCADMLARSGHDANELEARWTCKLEAHGRTQALRQFGVQMLGEMLAASPYLSAEPTTSALPWPLAGPATAGAGVAQVA